MRSRLAHSEMNPLRSLALVAHSADAQHWSLSARFWQVVPELHPQPPYSPEVSPALVDLIRPPSDPPAAPVDQAFLPGDLPLRARAESQRPVGTRSCEAKSSPNLHAPMRPGALRDALIPTSARTAVCHQSSRTQPVPQSVIDRASWYPRHPGLSALWSFDERCCSIHPRWTHSQGHARRSVPPVTTLQRDSRREWPTRVPVPCHDRLCPTFLQPEPPRAAPLHKRSPDQ